MSASNLRSWFAMSRIAQKLTVTAVGFIPIAAGHRLALNNVLPGRGRLDSLSTAPRGRDVVVAWKLPKLLVRVRFPPPAPISTSIPVARSRFSARHRAL
jgi:hypothetical protein